MRATIHRYLIEHPAGATARELLDLVFTHAGIDPEFGPAFIRTLLAGDPRFRFRSEGQCWVATIHEASAMPLAEAEFAVVDLETTGGSPLQGDTIIEIGAVFVDRDRRTRRFEQLINPGRPLPPFITRLTGITDEMLAGQPCLGEVLPEFLKLVGERVLVAHNARFDLGFLNAAAQLHLGGPLHQPHLCTLRLARRLLPGLRRRGLDAVAGHFAIPLADRHRALGDAMITTEIFVRLLELLASRGITRLDQVLALQSSARDGRAFFCPLPQTAIEGLPQTPGVYRFYDKDRRLLYIGKAKNLRQRVRHYLSNADGHSGKTLDLIRHIHAVQVQEAGSELEAALLEADAIRAEKPPYNRLSKQLPRIAFLKLTADSQFPRLLVSSRPGSGDRCFGPFRSRESAIRAMELANRLFGLRTCAGKVRPDPAASPCFQGQIDACRAPCAGRTPPARYRKQVAAFLRLMAGDAVELSNARDRLLEQRSAHTSALRFEAAARAQRDIEQLDRLVHRQRTLSWVLARQHFLVLQPTVGHDAALAYLVLAGRLVERRTLRSAADLNALAHRAQQFEVARRSTLHAEEVAGIAILAAWLRDRGERDGAVMEIKDPAAAARNLTEWQAALAAVVSAGAAGRC